MFVAFDSGSRNQEIDIHTKELLAIHDQAAQISTVFITSAYYQKRLDNIYANARQYVEDESLEGRLLHLVMNACQHICREHLFRVDALRIATKPLKLEARRLAEIQTQ